jgi:hypothetical protein
LFFRACRRLAGAALTAPASLSADLVMVFT